ncbi:MULTISPECIES: alpha/beta hydrolase [Streptomyces]|uniref:AB hydrolase-1 domain-containing protein n=1 Tax=Streptomyces luteosporeus TaxID=173856 RepID=A0ABP6G2Z5_9ACTN
MDGSSPQGDGSGTGPGPTRWWRPATAAGRRWLVIGACLALAVTGLGGLVAADRLWGAASCDKEPTDINTTDYSLDFTVQSGAMPDPQFNGQAAKLHMHRVQPVYEHGRCSGTPARAAVLIHGRSLGGAPVFDLKGKDQDGNKLSLQGGLARAGIDTFVPDLLGYGESTRFAKGLDDPHNASLRAYPSGSTTCPYPEGCDRTHNPIFPLDQQGTQLATNPLAGKRYAHSSGMRFATTDTWVRDVRQAIDDALDKAKPTSGKVTLLGYSLGGNRVGRTLYAANPNPLLPNSSSYIAKVDRAVFVSSFFGGTKEESTPSGGFVTFPLTLGTRKSLDAGAALKAGTSEADCSGHVIAGSLDEQWKELMQTDGGPGRKWGGTDANHPDGLNRSPTFSTFGWNDEVAGQLSVPALVVQGADDAVITPSTATRIYDVLPASVTNKVLVQVKCASHALPNEGCSGSRCMPPSGRAAYGQAAGTSWAGPHQTLQAALIEWITKGTFNGSASGKFTVDRSGVVS